MQRWVSTAVHTPLEQGVRLVPRSMLDRLVTGAKKRMTYAW